MIIGISARAAFKRPRTGVEEYTYQLIDHLTTLKESKRHRFILYSHKNLKWPLPMWTQFRLAVEMAVNPPDVLFIPVHVLPLIHPQNSVVTIHGLEYEYYPEMYPWSHLRYLRWSTRYALRNARQIIAVSENTKRDLIKLYGGQPEKIKVIYHGVDVRPLASNKIVRPSGPDDCPFILFIGRLEAKKNIQGLVKAFDFLKKKYRVPHKLILVGPKGYGYQEFKSRDVIEKGYISQEEKSELLKNADLFVLPSFYEGFGMPVLEAQAVGCPVVASNVSSMPEVAGQGALLIKPENIEEIAEAIYRIISNEEFRRDLIAKGNENVKKFSWQKCAKETLRVLESKD